MEQSDHWCICFRGDHGISDGEEGGKERRVPRGSRAGKLLPLYYLYIFFISTNRVLAAVSFLMTAEVPIL